MGSDSAPSPSLGLLLASGYHTGALDLLCPASGGISYPCHIPITQEATRGYPISLIPKALLQGPPVPYASGGEPSEQSKPQAGSNRHIFSILCRKQQSLQPSPRHCRTPLQDTLARPYKLPARTGPWGDELKTRGTQSSHTTLHPRDEPQHRDEPMLPHPFPFPCFPSPWSSPDTTFHPLQMLLEES